MTTPKLNKKQWKKCYKDIKDSYRFVKDFKKGIGFKSNYRSAKELIKDYKKLNKELTSSEKKLKDLMEWMKKEKNNVTKGEMSKRTQKISFAIVDARKKIKSINSDMRNLIMNWKDDKVKDIKRFYNGTSKVNIIRMGQY